VTAIRGMSVLRAGHSVAPPPVHVNIPMRFTFWARVKLLFGGKMVITEFYESDEGFSVKARVFRPSWLRMPR
jgi:hypothetical protein